MPDAILNGTITDVPGVKAGHCSDFENGTGTTVLIFEKGAVGGVDVRGLASGSRELLALDPLHVTALCHAVCLSGGSAFGLAAADGVMQYLSERNIGYFARVAVVPIVPAAIIFDLSFKNAKVRPDRSFGCRACEAAGDGPLAMGSVGAGTGATVGKLFGIEHAVKAGVGSASARTDDGITVGALAVVNNLGDVLDHKTGRILAGTRDPKTGSFVDTARTLARLAMPTDAMASPVAENTNLIVAATDAKLDKAGANKFARMASAGMARVLSPAHSTFDGDIVFAFSTGQRPSDVNRVGAIAAELVMQAINRAVLLADGLGTVPALKDLNSR
ncbi:MAG TPA: P1 family peptidase [bacterium]|nr:P1 family peptidase [bacterium]